MHRRRLLTMAIGLATLIAIAIPGLTATARDQATTFRQTNPDSDVPRKTQSNNLNVETGPVFKGLAIGFDGLTDHLYAANFRSGKVDVFNTDFSPAASFTDPKVPNGYAPFNVQNLGGALYVSFAKQDAARHDD